jgi:hypothetical protein
MKKATDSEIVRAYEELKSIWKVADRFNMCGQSVHERLKKLNILLKGANFSQEEIEKIKAFYQRGFESGDGSLDALAKEMGRIKHSICRKARALGLTNIKRVNSENKTKEQSRTTKRWMQENEHPKGMKGKNHSEETKKVISERSTESQSSFSEEKRESITTKMLKTRLKKYGSLAPAPLTSPKVSWKQSWRTIGGKRKYFRSSWEANYARWLEWQKVKGEILDWEHEPKTFWFEEIKRGTRSYLPDFKVIKLDGSHEWHEVKGWMDQKSITKIKRFRKYYPEEKLEIFDSKWFKRNKNLAYLIKDWEK